MPSPHSLRVGTVARTPVRLLSRARVVPIPMSCSLVLWTVLLLLPQRVGTYVVIAPRRNTRRVGVRACGVSVPDRLRRRRVSSASKSHSRPRGACTQSVLR